MEKRIYQEPRLKHLDAFTEGDTLQITTASDSYSSDPQLSNDADFDESLDDELDDHLDGTSLQGIWKD